MSGLAGIPAAGRAAPGPALARGAARGTALGGLRRGLRRTGASASRMLARVGEVLGPLGRLIGAKVGPRLAVLSPAAWIALGIAAAALVAGGLLGWQELVFLGITIAAALVVCAAFLFGRTTYAVTVALEPPRVVVGERALGRLLVVNDGKRGVLPARIELPIGTGVAEFSIPGLKPAGTHDELFAVPTNRRAVILAGPAISVRGDELGLLRRRLRWTDPIDLFVHPATVPLTPSAAGLVRDLEGQVTKKITNNDLSFHALRPYEWGDDRRYVHWRSSARTGQLMVRQFEETRRTQLTILLSEAEQWYASETEFELAVSAMASIAAQVIRDGTQMSVVTERRRLRVHAPVAMLDDSCRIELSGGERRSAREFARVATARLPPPSVVVLVAGSTMTTSDYRSVQVLFASDTTVLVVRVAEQASPTLQPIAGMKVATIGSLEDLPKVMRRAS